MTASATIVGLFIYPLKSARGIARERTRTAATGFEWDRQWMLIDGRGTFLSQRTHPQLARIVPQLTVGALRLTAPGLPPLAVPLASQAGRGGDQARADCGPGERIAVRVHRDPCVGIDEGRAAAEWASAAVRQVVRLVRVPPQPERRANPAFAGAAPAPMGFADGYPVLVCNAASLDDLNTRLPEGVPMERFRPNIVLGSLPAWAEDRIDSLVVGALTLRLVKPCTRCTIPSIDQRTGLRSTDPMPVLKTFRFSRELGGVLFGENAVIAAGAGALIERGALCQVSFGN
jgi:uncharacterized protein